MTTAQQPEVATERAALIVYLLSQGRRFHITEIQAICNVKRRRAYEIMESVSRVVPVRQEGGEWEIFKPDEITE